VGQRTFETRSLYLILAEKLFTLPAADHTFPVLVSATIPDELTQSPKIAIVLMLQHPLNSFNPS
jgi:hypothetical protein